MSQYRNRAWYIGRFEGGKNGTQRPPKTIGEAYALIVGNLKRPGWKGEDICAKKAYEDFYKEPFMSPEDRERLAKQKELEELNRQIEAKKAEAAAVVVEIPVAPPTPVAPELVAPTSPVDPPLTKEQFKEKFCKDLGFGSVIGLTRVQGLQYGKAWKKYPNKVGE